MPEKGIRNRLSQIPVQVFIDSTNENLGAATGFFYESNAGIYFITNGHVVTCRDPLSGELLGVSEEPKQLRLRMATYAPCCLYQGCGQGHFRKIDYRVDLYDESGPKWKEHPTLGLKCDVVALDVPRPDGMAKWWHEPINDVYSKRVPVVPGATVFISGYPIGIRIGVPETPIMKSGYIASEPHYGVEITDPKDDSVQKLPAFLLDAQTRQGMSGSPVVANSSGIFSMTDPYEDVDLDNPTFWDRDDVVVGGNVTEFIGCYSGRVLGLEEHEAGLGLCYGKEVIDLVCTHA